MKNLFILLVVIGFVGCKGVDYTESMNGLTSSWDATTGAATEFAQMLRADGETYSTMMSTVAIDSVAFSKLKPEGQEAINAAKEATNQAAMGFGKLGEEASAFMAEWATKGEMVTELKTGLEAKTLGADATAKIAELTTYATDGLAKIEGWKTTLAGVKTTAAAAHTSLMEVVAQYIPAKK